ncbi:MAG: transcriptional regulator, MerR family [Herbinix sp.]|jgi:hypothetical protein|nr:transcriptional regulator, MerR family [Herbinix sp.]
MKDYYSIDDLATMTMLTTRTLRNYISQGLLKGEKVDGAWKFSNENIDSFFREESIIQSIQSKKNGMVYEFMTNEAKPTNMVCSLYDYSNVKSDEAENIYAKIVALVNSNNYGNIQFSYAYNAKKKAARIILIGDTLNIHNLMSEYFNM